MRVAWSPGFAPVPPKYVNTAEAAKHIGVHARTLQRWVREGLVVPDHRTAGGHARWDADRVLRTLGSELRSKLEQQE